MIPATPADRTAALRYLRALLAGNSVSPARRRLLEADLRRIERERA